MVTADHVFRNWCYSSSFPGMLYAARFELRFQPRILTVSVFFTGLRKKEFVGLFFTYEINDFLGLRMLETRLG